MCGIAGNINYQGKSSKTITSNMLHALVHRGPDGEGTWSDHYVSLGMRRLSIIDLSGGMQPLFNEDKSIVIVGNGEIYNYQKLNKQIIKQGHKPRTGSDIETIIHLYEEYGVDCVEKLEGMFAFALYDLKSKTVFLARDRMGEKPLYYSSSKDQFLFASELKAIVKEAPHWELDPDAINQYFHYYFVPEPKTLFPNIHKLPAGHLCLINLKTSKYQLKKYWDPSSIVANRKGDSVKIIKSLFKNATKSTLVADVDVAVSLSGGLDSSAILSSAAAMYPKNMKAFTIGYEGTPSSDERALAKVLTDQYGVKHIQAELKIKDVVNHFPDLVYDGDDPIADIAGHGIYSVAKLARDHGLKVLLGGLGGDELFWGYPWVRQITRDNYVNQPSFHFYDKITPYKNANSFIFKLLTQEFKQQTTNNYSYTSFQPKSKLKTKADFGRASQNLIRDYWLISNCIAYNDRLSMAASVELRSPLLNHRLVEAAYTLKDNVLSFEKDEGKYYFKQAIKSLLPSIIYNAPKRGFQPPVFLWLLKLIARYISLLSGGYLTTHNILNSSKIRLLKSTWIIYPTRWIAIYQLIVLEIWCREYILNQTPESIRHAK